MKSLFYTILIIDGTFLGYDYFLAPPGQKIVFKSLNPPPKKKVVPAQLEPEVKSTVAETAPVAPPPVMQAEPKPAAPAAAPAPAAAAASSGPTFDPIEVLTGNWLKIPPSAFPREVSLLQDAMFKMSVGASKVAAGGKAFVMTAENGVLTLAPTKESAARAQLPIDGTNLKALLNEVYEKWKIVRAEELKASAARRQLANAQPVAAASSSEVEASGKPVRATDGTYPLLIASMKRGQVTEITPDNIKAWGDPQPAQVQGKNGWGLKVNYEAKTIFGLMPVEAQAVVLDGKVLGWYYTGSGEEVP